MPLQSIIPQTLIQYSPSLMYVSAKLPISFFFSPAFPYAFTRLIHQTALLIYYLLGHTIKLSRVFKMPRWLGCLPEDFITIGQEARGRGAGADSSYKGLHGCNPGP